MKKTQLLLAIMLFSISFQTFSQKIRFSKPYSYYFYVYKITSDEVKEIYLDKKFHISDDKFQHTLIDSFYTDSMYLYLSLLENGNYIFKSMKYGYENYDLHLKNDFIITNRGLNNQLGFTVMLPDKSFPKDILVYLNKEKINFNEEFQMFTIPYQRKSKYIFIEQNGLIAVKRFYSTKESTIKSTLLAKYRKSYYSGYGYWNKINKTRGYIATDKPIYRIGDTLKFKAFILKNERKVNRELKLKVIENRNSKIIYTDIITPIEKGVYQGEFVITDSFQLDKSYEISLNKNSKRYSYKHYYEKNNFYIEDYQLNEITYSAKVDDELLDKKQSVYLTATGLDANNKPVFGGKVKLELEIERINNLYDTIKYLPFTLWEKSLPFDITGKAYFKVPDSLLPYAKLQLEAKFTFTNANNEIQEKTVSFDLDKKTEHIVFEEDGSNLKIQYSNRDKSKQTRKILLKQYLDDGIFSSSDSIQIPAEIEINPLVYQYELEDQYSIDVQYVSSLKSMVHIDAYRTNDSFFIELINPRELACMYQVFIGKEKILEGKSTKLSVAKAYQGDLNINIYIEFIWGGTSNKETANLIKYPYKINIQSNIPEDIEPGEKSDIKLQITDYKNEPLKNVNLAAYAINSQFDNSNVPYLKDAGYEIIKYPQGFEQDYSLPWQNNSVAISKKLIDQYHLDTNEYYRFYYPNNGYYTEYIPLKNKSSQFTPYIVGSIYNHDIAMIYLDDTLIYFRNNYYKHRPYSFKVKPGFHKITLRTKNKTIVLQNIEIKENQKLLFSIDISNPPPNAKIYKSKNKLSKKECEDLKRYYLQIDFEDPVKYLFIYQDEIIFKVNQGGSNYYTKNKYIGPFNPEKDIYIMTNFGYTLKHNMKNGNSINVKDSVLTPDTFTYFSNYISAYSENPNEQQFAYEKEDIITDTNFNIYRYNNYAKHIKLKKDFGMFWNSGYYQTVLIFPHGNYDTLKIYSGYSFNDLTFIPDTYDIFMINYNSSVISFKNIKILPDSFYCLSQINGATWDSAGILRLLSKFKVVDGEFPFSEHNFSILNQQIIETPSDNLIVKGQIIDETLKTPIKNASIDFKSYNGTIITLKADTNGYFMLVGLNPGTYDICFRPNSILSYLFSSKEIGCYELKSNMVYNFEIYLSSNFWLSYFSISNWMNGDRYYDDVKAYSYSLPGVYNVALYDKSVGNIAFGRRGSRLSSNIGYLDGVNVRNKGVVQYANYADDADYALEFNKITGGIAAEYGDYRGGVFNRYDGDPWRGNAYYSINDDNFNSGIYLSGYDNSQKLYYAINDDPSHYFYSCSDLTFDSIEYNKPLIPGHPSNLYSIDFRSNFSDNAYWQPNLWTDENGEACFTVTFPDNITSWESHILAMDNHKRAGQATFITKSYLKMNATLANPRFLIEGDQATMVGKIQNNTSDSIEISYGFKVDGKDVLTKEEKIFKNYVANCPLSATIASDSLELTFGATSGKYSDGEKWFIPVYQKGVEETIGQVFILEDNTKITYEYNPKNGPLTVYIQKDAASALQQSIDYLKEYEYACNEQLASKLVALIVDKNIKEAKSEKFNEEHKIKGIIRKLENNKNDEECWGWWNKSKTNPWMTAYVIGNLLYAQSNGFEVKELDPSINSLLEDFQTYSVSNQLFILKTFAENNVEIDYDKYFSIVSNDTKSFEDKLLQATVKAYLEMQNKKEIVFDNLNENQLGSVFVNNSDQSFYSNNYYQSILAYQFIKSSEDSTELLPKIQRYFLENLKNTGWTNTYQTAMILKTIVPDILGNQNSDLKANVSIEEIGSEAIELPFKQEIVNENGVIHIEKTGDLPIYATCYQKYWNKEPIKSDMDFTVSTCFKKDFEKIVTLKAGELVTLEVTIETTKESDYVMIEVPIPAGCSYFKTNDSKNSNEVHREYYKQKTVIFCEKLPMGKHKFEITLQPRFTGTYTLNPAKAELMYFPSIYGRNSLKEVGIE